MNIKYQHKLVRIVSKIRGLTGSGELFALEWSDIDLEGNIIKVSKSYNKMLKEIKSTKAGYWRNVPISPDLKTLLIDLKNKTSVSTFVLPRIDQWERGNQSKSFTRLSCRA